MKVNTYLESGDRMDKNYIITQSNHLIEARHTKPLTAREQKIVLTMVSMIEPTDEDFKDYDISVKEFSGMLGLEGSAKYTELKEITKDLMTKSIEIPKEDGGWLFANWISSAEYQKGEGIISLSFSPKLMPYLLQLKTAFTSYRLSNILSLKSTYSIRLYELMKKWQHLGRWETSVHDLKLKLGVLEGRYKQYGHFKSKALNLAMKEINEKTDLHITFKEIKKGRKVENIEFSIQYFKEKEIRLPKKNINEPQTNSTNNIRERLNALAQNYSFEKVYFADIYSLALRTWNEQAENELTMLVKYTNNETSITSPLGFIKAKLKTASKVHATGEKISFSKLELSGGRKEMVPEWFGKKDDSKEELKDPKIEEERQKLLRELGVEK